MKKQPGEEDLDFENRSIYHPLLKGKGEAKGNRYVHLLDGWLDPYNCNRVKPIFENQQYRYREFRTELKDACYNDDGHIKTFT